MKRKSPERMSHFARSFVNKECANSAICATGPGTPSSLLLWSCSFCSCSRTLSSVSATAVNLHTRHQQTHAFVVFGAIGAGDMRNVSSSAWPTPSQVGANKYSPLLEVVQTGVRWSSNAGHLLPALPLG